LPKTHHSSRAQHLACQVDAKCEASQPCPWDDRGFVRRVSKEADDVAEFLLLYRGGARPGSDVAGQQLASSRGEWLRRIAVRAALVATGDPIVGGRIVGNSANIEACKDYGHDGVISADILASAWQISMTRKRCAPIAPSWEMVVSLNGRFPTIRSLLFPGCHAPSSLAPVPHEDAC